MNRAEIIKYLSPTETIINVLRYELVDLNRKLPWVAGDEWYEIKANIESVENALEFAFKLHFPA